MDVKKLRDFHRKIAPLLLPFLFVSAVTGLLYRIGRSWFEISKESGNKILYFHSGEFLGANASVIYSFLIGLGLLILTVSGLWMLRGSKVPKAKVRKSHRVLGLVLALPLIITAVTGFAYQAGIKWFGADEKVLKLIMSLHQGSWLGPDLRPFYILLVGGGLIFLCITGMRLWLRTRRSKSSE